MSKKIQVLAFSRSSIQCADVSQGNQARFGDNAGKQCVAMSLTAIVFKNIKGIFNWDSFVLNNILLYGNSLYSCIRASVKKGERSAPSIGERIITCETEIYLQTA